MVENVASIIKNLIYKHPIQGFTVLIAIAGALFALWSGFTKNNNDLLLPAILVLLGVLVTLVVFSLTTLEGSMNDIDKKLPSRFEEAMAKNVIDKRSNKLQELVDGGFEFEEILVIGHMLDKFMENTDVLYKMIEKGKIIKLVVAAPNSPSVTSTLCYFKDCGPEDIVSHQRLFADSLVKLRKKISEGDSSLSGHLQVKVVHHAPIMTMFMIKGIKPDKSDSRIYVDMLLYNVNPNTMPSVCIKHYMKLYDVFEQSCNDIWENAKEYKFPNAQSGAQSGQLAVAPGDQKSPPAVKDTT